MADAVTPLEAQNNPPLVEAQPQSSESVLAAIEKQGLASKEKLQTEFDKFKEVNKGKLQNFEATFFLKMALKINGIDAKANSGVYGALEPDKKEKVDATINQLKTIFNSQPEAKPDGKAAEAKKDGKEAAFTPLTKEQLGTIVENDQLPSNATEKTKGIMDNLKAVGYKLGIKDEKLFVTRILKVEGKPFVIEPISFKISADTDIDAALQKFLDEAKTKAKPVAETSAAQSQTPVEATPSPTVESAVKPVSTADTVKPAEVKPAEASSAPANPANQSEAKPAEATPTPTSTSAEASPTPAVESAAKQVSTADTVSPAPEAKDKLSVKTTMSFSEIGDKISGLFKGIFSKKEEKQPIEKQQVASSGVETQPPATKTPAGRGFTLGDIQSDSGKPKPKFAQQPNQQDPNVNVGRIQVEGREASANQTPVKPKPNLGKVDISNTPADVVINPKTGEVEI
ncbi:MAG: hypothetical protein PHO48_03100 [Candidatus Gracilibacteria bacterium]|jgi:hypothetical protein|nr:hypothetical protein [Candidatus Gracilibacteria bacterium]MDD5179297.1 hypothetical protein [Candidatus Gracilibacteria bacterium]